MDHGSSPENTIHLYASKVPYQQLLAAGTYVKWTRDQQQEIGRAVQWLMTHEISIMHELASTRRERGWMCGFQLVRTRDTGQLMNRCLLCGEFFFLSE